MQEKIYIDWSIESDRITDLYLTVSHNYKMTLNMSNNTRRETLESLERWLISNKRRIRSWSFDEGLSTSAINQHDAIESIIIKTLNK